MFLRALVVVLETIFLVGLAGSLVVAIMAFVGDVHVFFGKDEVEKPVVRSQPQVQTRRAESH